MMNGLEIISAFLGIAGGILNVLKNKWGFLIWFVGNILWVVYGLMTKQYYFVMQYAVFTSISIWGFKRWLSEEIKLKRKR